MLHVVTNVKFVFFDITVIMSTFKIFTSDCGPLLCEPHDKKTDGNI